MSDQVIRILQDSVINRQDPAQRKQSHWLMEIRLLEHLSMALEITQDSFRSNFFVLDDPGAKINEQGFGSDDGRSKLGASRPRLA